jgi:hypothetical protein
MKLSVPIFVLKQKAKALSRSNDIPLHQALNQVANKEGFDSWSLLSKNARRENSATTLMAQLRPGDLVLVGSRPGQGKTLLGIKAAIQTMRLGHHAAIFTLYCSRFEVTDIIKSIGEEPHEFRDRFIVDDDDRICAAYVSEKLAAAPSNTMVVIDYLQLLDQGRTTPDLVSQVQSLKALARKRQFIILCLSQISRSFDSSSGQCPGVNDVRLPSPMDLSLFDKTCFLNKGKMQIGP